MVYTHLITTTVKKKMIKKVVLLCGLSALGFTSAHAAYQLSVSTLPEQVLTFQTANGLGKTPQTQATHSGLFSTEKMPGISQYGKVTFENGWVANDKASWGFLGQLKLHANQKHTYYLIGPDGTHYVLLGAWPANMPNTTLEDNGQSVALDALVLNHERMVIYAPNEQ